MELARQRDQQGQAKEIQNMWNFEKQQRVVGATLWCCLWVRRVCELKLVWVTLPKTVMGHIRWMDLDVP